MPFKGARALLGLLLLLGTTGCSGNCLRHSDCKVGEVCAAGQCQPPDGGAAADGGPGDGGAEQG